MDIKIDDYEKDFCENHWSFSSMIGRGSTISILKGCFPSFDEEDNYVDFLLDGENPSGQKMGKAFIFCGEPGTGKKTLDNAFSDYLMKKSENFGIPFSYYEIPLEKLRCEHEELSTADYLKQVFCELKKLSVDEKKHNSLLYISLGNITDLLARKKYAKKFAVYVIDLLNQELLHEENPAIYLSACVDFPSNELYSFEKKEPFIITEVEKPDSSEREKYYQFFQKKYPQIKFGYSCLKMSELSEDFTFSMMKSVLFAVYATVSGNAENDEFASFLNSTAEQDYIVEKDIIDEIIRRIKKQAVLIEPKKIPVQSEAVTYIQTVQAKPETNPEIREPDQGENEENIQLADTPSEQRRKINEILQPFNLEFIANGE